jgi:hypothetical protein
MISKKDCIQSTLEKFPEFQETWQEHLDWWEGEEAGLCNDMSQFSHYVTELIIEKKSDNLPEIFNFVETLMVDGDLDVQNAAATCFLENLINITPEKINPNSFVHLLGTESRDYCKAWDEFTGVTTEGLEAESLAS